jgi:hypothetical protein
VRLQVALLLNATTATAAAASAAAAAELLTGRLPWANDTDWLAQVATGGGANSRVMNGFGSSAAAHLPGHGEY